MSSAERYAKGRERYARTRRLRASVRVLTIGAILAGAGGWTMYSDTTHQLNGKPATATLMEHIKTCTVEYQRVGQEPRKDPMACDAAEQFQRLIGSNKIKVSHEFLARVQFPLEDGRKHEAKVDENKLDSYRLPVGTKLAVVYAPGNPADVRAVLVGNGSRFR